MLDVCTEFMILTLGVANVEYGVGLNDMSGVFSYHNYRINDFMTLARWSW